MPARRWKNLGEQQIITPRRNVFTDIFDPPADNFDPLADNFDPLADNFDHLVPWTILTTSWTKMSAKHSYVA